MKNVDKLEIRKLEGNEIAEVEEFVTFKIIIVGNSGVGKSSLLKRAVQDKFKENYQTTIGFEFLLLYYDVNGTKMKLQIWDTCGQEMYRSLIQGFYRNTSLTVLVYAINERRSFEELDLWLKDIRNSTETEQPIILVGNKSDLEKELRQVKEEEGKEFVKMNKLEYFTESSAKSGYQVEEIFMKAVEYLYKENIIKKKMRMKKMKLDANNGGDLDNLTVKKKKKCC